MFLARIVPNLAQIGPQKPDPPLGWDDVPMWLIQKMNFEWYPNGSEWVCFGLGERGVSNEIQVVSRSIRGRHWPGDELWGLSLRWDNCAGKWGRVGVFLWIRPGVVHLFNLGFEVLQKRLGAQVLTCYLLNELLGSKLSAPTVDFFV